jgi:hypothetical protein
MADRTTTTGRPGPPDSDDALVTGVARQQRALVTELGAGAGLSTIAGAALWAWGRRTGREGVSSFGRQTVAWAAVDAGIALWGRLGFARSPADPGKARSAARRMRLVTAVNAGLDVAYVTGGAALTRYAHTEARRGDGAAIVVQGLFLTWLDARHARRFHQLTRG